MTTEFSKEQLIAELERAADEPLSFFSGPGWASAARIDRWGAWDVLAHFPYWHYATGWGIASAGRGGPPWQVTASADEVNDAALALHAGESFDDLVRTLQVLQARLVRVARDRTRREREKCVGFQLDGLAAFEHAGSDLRP